MGEEVLRQGGVCKEKVSEDGGEEQWEDNEGQEEETLGENTEESQGEKTGEKNDIVARRRKGRREMGQDPVTVQGGDRGTRTVPRCGRREKGGMIKRRQQ